MGFLILISVLKVKGGLSSWVGVWLLAGANTNSAEGSEEMDSPTVQLGCGQDTNLG